MFKKLLQLKTLLVALLVMTGAGNVWADEVTYTFTTKSWGATIGNTQADWTSGQDGGQLTQGRGIQVTTSASGANGTSPVSYSNISKIVVKYCTNADKGAGKIKVKVGGGNEQSFTVSKPSSGGTTLKNATFTFPTAETGNVKVTVNCTTNSVYIHSVTITYSSGSTTETCATPTFSPVAGTYTSAQSVTISTTTAGATIYYTTDGTDPTESSSVYSTPIYVSKTTTIKAMAAKEGMTNSSVATAVVTVTSSEPAPTFVKVTDVSALAVGDKITFVNEGNNYALGAFKSNNYGAVSVTISENTFKSNEVEILTLEEGQGEYAPQNESVWAFKKDNGKYLNAPGGIKKNYMRESSDLNAESSAVIRVENGNAAVRFINFSLDNTQGRVIVRYNPNNGSPMFSCYASGQEDIQIYKIVTDATVSVTAAGYATFSSTSALDFTNVEGICAYTATVEKEAISFTRVNKVRANTGVLLRSVEGGAVEEAVPSLTGAADVVTGNLFVAVSEDIASLASEDENNNYYILNNGSNGIGFYLAYNKKVGAGKAYLAVPKTASVRGFISFDFSDPATGIATIGGNAIEGTAFDLQGRRVNAPKGGLYIINGKKVIVK